MGNIELPLSLQRALLKQRIRSDESQENTSFLDRGVDQLLQFLDSYFESKDAAMKVVDQEFKAKWRDEEKQRREQERQDKKRNKEQGSWSQRDENTRNDVGYSWRS